MKQAPPDLTALPRRPARAFYLISGSYTLSAALIWGVNTLFLLDAGLDLFETFLANGVFTAAMVVFEVPTGVFADTRGRRQSFLWSLVVLLAGTLWYVLIAEAGGGLLQFSLASVVMGIGFTLYSGAVEAWVVDAVRAEGYEGSLDPLFARGATVTGVAILVGTIGGGALGSVDLSVPFVARCILLAITFGIALVAMHDQGFTPRPLTLRTLSTQMGSVARQSLRWGWNQPRMRLLVTMSFFQVGFLMWAWYAWQPYLLDLLDSEAIWVAGGIAAANSVAAIAGNTLVQFLSRYCSRRTTILAAASLALTVGSIGLGVAGTFWGAFAMLVVLMMAVGVIAPVKQAFLHQLVPSEHRATVVSFDSMIGNSGGIGLQTGLGAVARNDSIPTGYVLGGLITSAAFFPLYALRRMGGLADRIIGTAGKRGPCAGQGIPANASLDTTVSA